MDPNFVSLISLCLERNMPFVIYRFPGEGNKLSTWLQRSGNMLFVEDIMEVDGKQGFVYAPFHRFTDFPVVFFEPEYVSSSDMVSKTLLKEIASSGPLYQDYNLAMPTETFKAEYFRMAEKMISSFGSGLSKAVLSRVKLVEKQESFDVGLFFLRLLENHPEAFVHLINIPGAGCWLGATPEMLFRSNGKKASTVALAGTRRSPENDEAEWGEKEIEEQELVVRHVEDVINQYGIVNYIKEEPQTVNAGKLQHLSTSFHFQTGADFNATSFVRQLHPTPAVSGLPVKPALDLIRHTETHNREYYAGYCGPVNINGHTDLFVNLRCMKVMPQDLALYVGGGLTARSIPLHEWEETELKAKTLLTLI